jgi:transposase
MISREREAEILRLHHAEKWPVGTIASQLGVHHSTVMRVLAQAGLEAGLSSPRPSIADPYIPFIVEQLKKYPRLRASRLHQMVKERGYPGGPDHFRALVARHRPRPPAEAYLRLRTLPGEQAQTDWGHFGAVVIGSAVRKLMGFVMVLSFSRMVFLRFYLNAAMPNFLRGHVDAFHFFGGVPRKNLYDNLKSAVLERVGDAIRFHPTMLELSSYYRFLPRPVAVARGNEKGRVERAIRYIRDSFFAARTWTDLNDLNAQALHWCNTVAADRKCPEDRSRTVAEVFAEEQSKLLALPSDPFPTDERVEVHVRKTPYVRFDLNDYSIPYDRNRRTLLVVASLDRVRVVDGDDVIAEHPRTWDRGQTLENPAHIAALVRHKKQARQHRGIDRLHHAVPASRQLLIQLAERGGNLGGATTGLLRMLERDGPSELDKAIAEALERGTPHLGAVHQILDRRRRQRGQPPPVGPHLPNDPRVQGQSVTPHALDTYDQLRELSNDQEQDQQADE